MRCNLQGEGGKGSAGSGLTPVALPRTPFVFLAVLLAVCSACLSCGPSRKLSIVRESLLAAAIRLPPDKEPAGEESSNFVSPDRDTLKVTDLDGKELIVMKAVKDEKTGEMVATEQLNAAVVTARFRNIAERHGRIDLEFQVIVPKGMQDSEWQLRFHPDMFILEDSVRLDDVVITGADYRKAQLRGYQQYEKFLSRIVTDSVKFVDFRNLEIFLKRNIPQLYAFKSDSSFVSDAAFATVYGVTEREAVEHYTNRYLRWLNERLKARRGSMYAKYVKAPLVTEGIRLDTVIRNGAGDFIYNYVQTVNTRPRLRKVDIVLSGEIFRQDQRLYDMPHSEPLTFYISSVSAFADNTERFLTTVMSRNVATNTECRIDFETGKSEIRADLAGNSSEIDFIKANIRNLLSNESYDLDSVTIAASASPEGSEKSNNALSYARAKSAAGYFDRFIQFYKDSLQNEAGFFVSVDKDLNESHIRKAERSDRDIRFKSRSGGENWLMLDDLISLDTLMTEQQKYRYYDICKQVSSKDERELRLRREDFFEHIVDSMYPRLRTVRFRFALHRKGMVKDTVHTTVLDSSYMRGVQFVRDHDYKSAIEILRPYADFNTALAYVALDYNKSALSILETLPGSARVDYLLALVYSRIGDDRLAVEHYLHSCREDRSFVHRGNLDPEISSLVKRYNLLSQTADI